MNRYALRVCVVLIMSCASPALFAQQKNDGPPEQVNTLEFDTASVPDDELTTAIKALMKATGAMDLGRQMGKNIMDIDKQNPNNGLPQEFYDKLIKEFESEHVNRWMVNGIVKIYRSKFTLEEIKTITAFYETPTGKKASALSPVIMQQSMHIGEQIGRHLGMKIYLELVREGKIKQ